MTKDQAQEFLLKYCRGKGSMRQEKWAGMAQAAWQGGFESGKVFGFRVGIVTMTISVLLMMVIWKALSF